MHLRLKLKESHSANTSLLAAAGTPPHTLVPLAFLRGLCQAVPLVEAGGAAVCRSVSARVKSPSEEEFFSVLPVMSHSRTPG